MNKKILLLVLAAAVLLLSISALAANSDYPLTAHVNSAVFTHAAGRAPTNSHVTEIQIGNLIYVADDTCKAAVVGQDYPARLDKAKLRVLVGDKVCKYRVVGTRDATAK